MDKAELPWLSFGMTESAELLIGQTLVFNADPFVEGPTAATHSSRGGVLVQNGRIAALGPADELRAAHPDHGGHDEAAASRIAELSEARRILLAS